MVNHNIKLRISPIADTVNGSKARDKAEETIEHYSNIASQLWLSPEVCKLADDIHAIVKSGRTAWGSMYGPFGFGKTAAAITLWNYSRCQGYLAIPPLSCTNYNDLAYAIQALAEQQAPKIKNKIRKLFKEVWIDGVNHHIKNDAERYEVSPQKLRQILHDKINIGNFTLDSNSHRLVEFLCKLGELVKQHFKGLIIILDEMQQLLGPLDARSIIGFREFVWGMRTEISHCGIILAMDSLLEEKLSRWASDVLHRIRENGCSLQLSYMFNHKFPIWLWEQITSNELSPFKINPEALTQDVLLSLGQFVERPDLSNGPRTIVDVFSKAVSYYESNNEAYDIPNLVEDIHQGRFRYFGEGATTQKVLIQILSDEWIAEDETREILVRILAAFPNGCPDKIINRYISKEDKLKETISELFGPLLVELSEGLALEKLQQVRRSNTNWEQILMRCWETLPALDSLLLHVPDMLLRIIVPKLFPRGNPSNPLWHQVTDESSEVLTGWRILKGSFDENYPYREIAFVITDKEPCSWPEDVDFCIAFVLNNSIDVSIKPSAFIINKGLVSCIILNIPIFRPLEKQILPAEIERYHKFIQPEPFRPATILTAVYELESLMSNKFDTEIADESFNNSDIRRLKAYIEIALDFLIRELLQGSIDIGLKNPIQLRGIELLRALFTTVCHNRFPHYQTLIKSFKWKEVLSNYRIGLCYEKLDINERQGRKKIIMTKQELLSKLFNISSTATGDSFLRALGPLVKVSGTAQSFELFMSMHPAEIKLLEYLRTIGKNSLIPVDAAAQYLRHNGYIYEETLEIIKILFERELIIRDQETRIQIVKSESLMCSQLNEEIIEIKRILKLFGDNIILPDINGSISDLQKHLHELKEVLEQRIDNQISDLRSGINLLQDLVGIVMSSVIPEYWRKSSLCSHLKGFSSKLQETKENILNSLRNEIKRAEEDNVKLNYSKQDWALAWMRNRDTFLNSCSSLKERVEKYQERYKALVLWVPLNDQLCSTLSLCTKVQSSNPGLYLILNQLEEDFREQFATQMWIPLFSSEEFSQRLQSIQFEIQSLLYWHLKTFNEELEALKSCYRILLPSSAPPAFEVSSERSDKFNLIYNSYQNLYKWILEGFKIAFKDCQKRKLNGSRWRDIEEKDMTWKELDKQIEEAINISLNYIDMNIIKIIGDKVLRMLKGFESFDEHLEIKSVAYDNPEKPPNFRQLENLFINGRIVIKVEPK